MDKALLGNQKGTCFEDLVSYPLDEDAVAFDRGSYRSDSEALDSVETVASWFKSRGSSIGGRGTTFGLYIFKCRWASIWSDGDLAAISCLFGGLEEDPLSSNFPFGCGFSLFHWRNSIKDFQRKNSKRKLWRELVKKEFIDEVCDNST